jgi:hypothetical protein
MYGIAGILILTVLSIQDIFYISVIHLHIYILFALGIISRSLVLQANILRKLTK